MDRIAWAVLAAFIALGAARAADFPARAVIVVVPFAAGGPTDTVARIIADAVAEDLGQAVVVQNVGGAGGTLGASRVAQSAPDGYTLLLHNIGMATAPTLYRRLPFDPVADFAPIGLITAAPMTLIARTSLPADTLGELVGFMKQSSRALSIAHAGIGSASHLCGMLFMDATDTQLSTVPYNGTGPAMSDVVSGQIDVMCDQTTNTTQQIKAGQVKAYAVTVPERLPSLPDLPTAREAGLANFEIASWHGLYAPAGTPGAVIERLRVALASALANPVVIQRFAELGTQPVPPEQVHPGALAALLAAQIEAWRPVITSAGVYAD